MFNALRISIADKRLVDVLRRLIRADSVRSHGGEAVKDFISICWKWDKIREPIQLLGFDAEDLWMLHMFMMRELTPNVMINYGGPMLAPTMVFMNPSALVLAFQMVRSTSQDCGEIESAIEREAKNLVSSIRMSHTLLPID